MIWDTARNAPCWSDGANWIHPTGIIVSSGYGNGVTDAAPGIQAAIDAALADGGGDVLLPPGTFLLKSGLTIKQGVRIVGSGRGATTLKCDASFLAGDVIVGSNALRLTVRDLTITSASMRTSGAAIHLTGPTGTDGTNNVEAHHDLRNLEIRNQFQGILLDGNQLLVRGEYITIKNLAPGGDGLRIETGGLQGVGQYFRWVWIDGGTNMVANQPSSGIRIRATGEAVFEKVDVVQCQYGLLIDPQTASGCAPADVCAVNFDTCYFDTTGKEAVLIKPGTNRSVAQLRFVNCWTAGAGLGTGGVSTSSGFMIDVSNSGTLVYQVKLVNHDSFANALHGLRVIGTGTRAQKVIVNGGSFSDNNHANNSNGAGVSMESAFGWMVQGAELGNTPFYGALQKYGLLVDSGCDSFLYNGNMTTGNATAAVSDATTNGATRIKNAAGSL